MIAYAGSIPIVAGPIVEMLLAIVLARDGAIPRFITLVSLIRTPLPRMLEIDAVMRGHEVSDGLETVDGDGMHAGGIWGTLPNTIEMSAGLVCRKVCKGYRSSGG